MKKALVTKVSINQQRSVEDERCPFFVEKLSQTKSLKTSCEQLLSRTDPVAVRCVQRTAASLRVAAPTVVPTVNFDDLKRLGIMWKVPPPPASAEEGDLPSNNPNDIDRYNNGCDNTPALIDGRSVRDAKKEDLVNYYVSVLTHERRGYLSVVCGDPCPYKKGRGRPRKYPRPVVVPKRKRGRPRKVDNNSNSAGGGEISSGSDWKNRKSSLSDDTASCGNNDAAANERSRAKRRKRSKPKKSLASNGSVAKTGPNGAAKRKRGRPRRPMLKPLPRGSSGNFILTETADGNHVPTQLQRDHGGYVKLKRKRGRPRKVVVDDSGGGGDANNKKDDKNVTKRKRGRPRKHPISVVVVHEPTVKRKRGRPRKETKALHSVPGNVVTPTTNAAPSTSR